MRFGGEDQSSAMAGNAQAAAKTKATIKEVAKEIVKEAKNTSQRQNRPSKRWYKKGRHMPKNGTKKTNNQIKQTVEKDVKQKLKKEGLEGPRSRFSVRVSATIGKIGPNREQGPELQIATFMHPSLMKEPNDGTNFGPLQAAAAQWGLWRLSSLEIRFTPLVGSSAVTGSVYRVSLNLTQSPGNASWGGLGARKHRDIPVGKSVSWKLQRGDLAGPRQTWWMTDTNEEGGQSCGPMVEVHGLGKTSSTYQNQDWTGDLFIVEVDGRWEFTNYNAKPALGTLDRKSEDYATDTSGPGIKVGDDGVMKMTLPQASTLARFMSDACERSAINEGSVGETIWQIVDEGAGLASSVAPTPFSWLIKGAWWFVKKLAGRAGENTDDEYVVYASLADAQNNKPVIANRFTHVKKATTLTVTQVNSPNVGPGATLPAYHTESPYPLIPAEVPPPAGSKMLLTCLASPIKINFDNARESVFKATARVSGDDYLFSIKLGRNRAYATSGYLLRDPVAMTLEGQRITGMYDPFWMKSTGMSVHYRNTDTVIGQVIAYASDNWGTTSAPLTCAYWLVRVTNTLAATEPVSFYNYAPGAYTSGGTTLNPPELFTLNKAGVPTMNRSGGSGHTVCRVLIPRIESQTLMLVYSIGLNSMQSNGLTNSQPITGSSNDVNLNVNHSSDFGFWPYALTPIGLVEDRLNLWFTVPPDRPSDESMVDDIINVIQRRFRLRPVETSESEESSGDDSSESDGEHQEESHTPPKMKFAKEMMYEALRESDWTHVDAEALLATLSPKH
uniref:Capsid protein n=1 Tax=Raccoon dog astrovirus TaxID=2829102 RepID=A0AA49QCC2_9VIRU|nr:capsid protein [Raccoon dog astrovirus]WLE99421.1 capsid protein [Raccoon dog astrovirus]